jgi:hypothetical protein
MRMRSCVPGLGASKANLEMEDGIVTVIVMSRNKFLYTNNWGDCCERNNSSRSIEKR